MDYSHAEERKYLGGGDDDEELGFFGSNRPKARLSSARPQPGPVARVEFRGGKQKQEMEEDDAPPPPPPQSPPYRTTGGVVKSKFFNDEDDEDGVMDEEEAPRKRVSFKKPAAAQVKRTSRIVDEDEEAPRTSSYSTSSTSTTTNQYVDQTLEKMYKGMEFTIPIKRGQTGSEVIPYQIQRAAETVIHADKGLNRQTRQQLQGLVDHPDEFTVIDPQVIVAKTVDTGMCKVYLKEVVPISHLLMARVLKVKYQLYVTKKVYFPPEDFSEVVVKPYHGTGIEHAQPFGLTTELEAHIENDEDLSGGDFLDQVNAYMYAQGPISTREACDPEFIEMHVEAIKRIRSGSLVPIKKLMPIEKKLRAHVSEKQKKKRPRNEEENEEEAEGR